jgi:acetyl esterase/lipase
MGTVFEVLSTPVAYLEPAYYDRHRPTRRGGPATVPFGPDRLQRCVVWEPAEVRHDTVVMWFHGGGYLVGTPESMANAADVYNAQGYRFVSVGFRLMPRHRFPAQVDDAAEGVRAAMAWLRGRGTACESVVVGGSSAGGMSAALVAYDRDLQERHGIDGEAIRAYVSCAAVLDADDMLSRPVPPAPLGPLVTRALLDLPGMDPADERSVHEALLPYSPIAVARRLGSEGRLPDVPSFGVHGTADTASPFASEEAFADVLRRRLGPEAATLHAMEDPVWQHMITTVTMHKHQVETDPVLSHLFGWLADVAD